jgi:F-type H+-transporting ATPase subunit b
MDNPLVQLDPGLYIWTILTFLVLLGLLAKFAWRPLLDALERREEAIRKSLADADRAQKELARLQAESTRIIGDARVEADAIISRTRADATRVGEEMKAKARTDAENIVRNAERQIEQETSRALEKIRTEAVDLSVAIASKLLRRNLTRADNEQLIAETFKEIEASRRPN